MNIMFRVDASYKIGSGHVMRCLVLADALKSQGCNVVFLSRLLDGNSIGLIMNRGFEVHVLAGGAAITNSVTMEWLGVSQQDDAVNTIENLKGKLVDILFVDHYSLDATWEALMRPHVASIAVIDDLANRNHDCDFLIDQNFRSDSCNIYKGLVPEACKTLMGLQYAILSHEYRTFRTVISKKIGSVTRVLVYFGGTDWQNMTGLALKVLSQDEFRFLEVDVVVGSNYPFLLDLENLINKRSKTNIHRSLPNLAKLMSVADFAIGAGGTTTWERMCMGLPTLVISLADNQLPACESLQKEGLIDYLGSYNDVSDIQLTQYLRGRIGRPEENSNLSLRILEYVDGFGALRIVQETLPLSIESVSFRSSTVTDVIQICHICSDKTALGVLDGYSFESIRRVKETLQIDIDSDDCALFTIELNGLVLGVIKNQYYRETNLIVVSYILNANVSKLLAKLVIKSAEMTLFLMPAINPTDRPSYDEATCIDLRIADGCVQFHGHIADLDQRVVLVTAKDSWINEHVADFCFDLLLSGCSVRLVHELYKSINGDVCFYIGFDRLVPLAFRRKFSFNLVVHESALPMGRGWSPLSWQILEGKDLVCITLLDAADDVDSGMIFLQDEMIFDGSELIDELRTVQAQKTFKLCRNFLSRPQEISGNAWEQHGDISFYPRRLAEHSNLDVKKPILELFNHLRIADPIRYPSFFKLGNSKYKITIEKIVE